MDMMEGYNASRQPRVGVFREKPGSDIVKQGYLKKLKTMKKKYFILRQTSSSGPARLDYYDSEKKFKAAHHPPKRSIPLYTCFNINKKADTKHKFAIALFLAEDCFSVIAESEQEQDVWLNFLLEYQNEFLLEGEPVKVHYEMVWQGVIKPKGHSSCMGISGPYRLCLSDKSVCLIKTKEVTPVFTFQFSSIRRCGHSDNHFFMEVGRSSVTGAGELWMQVEETFTAESMHNAVLAEMHASRSTGSGHSFRVRSNTGSSTAPIRTANSGDEPFHRKRATSESHPNQGSPRKNRASLQSLQRPQSTVVYPRSNLNAESPQPISSSPGRAFEYQFDDRLRSDSVSSRSSRTSRYSDATEPPYENVPGHPANQSYDPVISPKQMENSFRSMTPETSFSSVTYGEDQLDSPYLPMTPGQRSMTPSPTRSAANNSDYLSMNPGQQRSATPSPTRHIERPGSAGSDGQELSSRSEGYMDMRPGSLVSSPASTHSSYMDMTPPASSGYIDMTPGQRTPTDPGYMVMEAGWVRTTAPIPIRVPKEPGYIDMGPASQPLPTVKEGGSGEAYLPMSPSGQSPVSSIGLKPAKVISYLSDDSMSGEFPKRAYSVGSRPLPKTSHRYVPPQEFLRRQPLDNSRCSSAPHLIVQKSRPVYPDANRNMDMSQCVSPLSQSVTSNDSDSFMEMEFYRPRTASDSYGSRNRSSSFGKQLIQGHRPRSSSYGQASRGKLPKIASMGRTDSFESVRTSQELGTKHRSQESLSKYSNSSRNSSNDSLKKLSEDLKSKKSLTSDYMDMGFDKRKTPSPNVHGVVSPKVDGYVDMTLGTSAPKSDSMLGTSVPKSLSRGISPSSSGHSLGSSPSSGGQGHYEKTPDAKVIKASGQTMQKQPYASQQNYLADNQLQISAARIKKSDKRSPSSSGKESEDENYVPFQPITAAASQDDVVYKYSGLTLDPVPRNNPGLKVQHGYSKSFDSAVKDPKAKTPSKHDKHLKLRIDDKHKSKSDYEKTAVKEVKSTGKHGHKEDKSGKHEKHEAGAGPLSPNASLSETRHRLALAATNLDSLSERVALVQTPLLEEKVDFLPDNDLFSNKVFEGPPLVTSGSLDSDSSPVKVASPPVSSPKAVQADTSQYMDYCPGAESLPEVSTKTPDPESSKVTEELPKASLAKLARHVEREYCEIDLPSAKTAESVNDDIAKNTDRRGSVKSKQKSPRGSSSSAKENENFTYMDFDPGLEKRSEESVAGEVKAPHRVRSFVAHGTVDMEQVAMSADTQASQKTEAKSNIQTRGMDNVDKSKHESIGHKTSARRLSDDNKENVGKCSPRVEGPSYPSFPGSQTYKRNSSTEEKGRDICGGGQSSRDSDYERKDVLGEHADDRIINAKFVVKRTRSAQSEQEVVVDEGYVDLDFSEVKGEVKGHQRSSSSSSSNSDKSRKLNAEHDKGCEDNILCPETPISYICDDSAPREVPSVAKEPSSPFKLPGNMPLKIGDPLRKVSVGRPGLVQSQGNGGNLARQSSVPIAPCHSPRSSAELNLVRCRKASGPAGFVSKSGNGNNGGGGKRSGSTSSQLGLDPVSGQELQKQKSMPCMIIEKKQVGGSLSEIGQSRHSFTDLSQYEEMSFSGDKLDPGKGRSNSQQQLSDSSQEKNVLNYAELELHGSSENVEDKSPRIVKSRHPSSIEDLTAQGDGTPVSYAEIDYLKTDSMKNSGNKEVKFTL